MPKELNFHPNPHASSGPAVNNCSVETTAARTVSALLCQKGKHAHMKGGAKPSRSNIKVGRKMARNESLSNIAEKLLSTCVQLGLKISCSCRAYLGSQGAHCCLPVLVLGTVALAESHQPGRNMGEADGAVGGVDVLPPRTLSPHGVHLQVLRRNFDTAGPACQASGQSDAERPERQTTRSIRRQLICNATNHHRGTAWRLSSQQRFMRHFFQISAHCG